MAINNIFKIKTCGDCAAFCPADAAGTFECRMNPVQLLTQYAGGYPPVRAITPACGQGVAKTKPTPKPAPKKKGAKNVRHSNDPKSAG